MLTRSLLNHAALKPAEDARGAGQPAVRCPCWGHRLTEEENASRLLLISPQCVRQTGGSAKGQSLGVAHCTSTMQSTEPGGQVCTCPCHTAVRGTEWLEDRSSMPRGLAWQGRHGTARCGGRGGGGHGGLGSEAPPTRRLSRGWRAGWAWVGWQCDPVSQCASMS